MKFKIFNLLLTGSIVSSVVLSGCKKGDKLPPIAAFSASETNIGEGTSISFTDQSSNNPTTWSWDFGDGNTSSVQNPSHIYISEGVYTVKLTVTNSYGTGTETKTNYITVVQTAGTFTDCRDSKVYKWVRIGEQVWMAENLAYTGCGIQHIINNYDWIYNTDYDGWCYYENTEDYGDTHGVLYQWIAAKTVCPSGWHLPTDDEWAQLENYLIENAYSYDGVIGNNGIAKSLATNSGWTISNKQGAVGNSDFPEYQNKTGFSALPSGSRATGDFYGLGDYGSWWSATEYDSGFGYYRSLCYDADTVERGIIYKYFGLSVRCIRD